MSDWLPIDSAPKDGRWIELCGGHTNEDISRDPDEKMTAIDTKRPVVAKWYAMVTAGPPYDAGYWTYAHWDSDWRSEYLNPTHWRAFGES